MGSTPGGAVFATAAGRGQSVTFLATSASIFTAADTESALWAPAPATQATKETTVKKVRATNQTPVVLSSKLICVFLCAVSLLQSKMDCYLLCLSRNHVFTAKPPFSGLMLENSLFVMQSSELFPSLQTSPASQVSVHKRPIRSPNGSIYLTLLFPAFLPLNPTALQHQRCAR